MIIPTSLGRYYKLTPLVTLSWSHLLEITRTLMGKYSSNHNHRGVVQSHPCFSKAKEINSPPWELLNISMMRPYSTFITQFTYYLWLHVINIQHSIIKCFGEFIIPYNITYTKVYFLPCPYIYYVCWTTVWHQRIGSASMDALKILVIRGEVIFIAVIYELHYKRR